MITTSSGQSIGSTEISSIGGQPSPPGRAERIWQRRGSGPSGAAGGPRDIRSSVYPSRLVSFVLESRFDLMADPATPTLTPTPADPRRRRLRWSGSLLIAAAALGPVLVGNALYTQRTVRSAADIVLHAEADAWARALNNRLRALNAPPTPEVLAAFLEESREAGLAYVARITREGQMQAGTPAGPIDDGQLSFGAVTWVGQRVRHVAVERTLRRPLRPPPESAAPADKREARPDPGARRGPPPRLLIEFEPRVYPHLERGARRTLTLGAATGATIILLAAWVWWSTRRRYAVEREAERARHLASLGEMSAVLAHEIRNPLASLKGHAQLLEESLRDPAAERPRSKAARIVDEAVRIERITTDLLDFVRQGELDRTPTDLGALVQLSIAEVVPPARLRLTLPPAPVELPLDAPRMRQVIENLARNAVQTGDGPVEVTIAHHGARATVTIRDHGPGIPPDQAERIFEPFVTTRTRGTGLGLAIARRIVERHGGTITATNHPAGGALFQLTLPTR
jgi:two-component system, NtrC family, sensor histidine kinase HydH